MKTILLMACFFKIFNLYNPRTINKTVLQNDLPLKSGCVSELPEAGPSEEVEIVERGDAVYSRIVLKPCLSQWRGRFT